MKYIGPPHETLKFGEEYKISTQRMTGRRYNPGRHEPGSDGKLGDWIDKVGEPDNRIMLWISNGYASVLFYKVFESQEDINKMFAEA